jgi:hypothetical protein
MKKRALLIGIDDYPMLSSHDQLEGSVNDAKALRALLRDRFGFAAEDIRLLIRPGDPTPGPRDGEPTREGILAAIEDLIAETGPDDLAVIAYSGHGTQVKDTKSTRPDGWDDVLVPCDGGYARGGVKPQPPILDHEIHDRLLRLEGKTPYVTVIFDCCNSGSAIRDPFGDRVRGLPPGSLSSDGSAPSNPSPASGQSRGWVPDGDRYVFIAASADGESAHECSVSGAEDGVVHGVLTFHLLRELSAAAPGTSMRSVFERVRARMAADQPYQHPHGEGALDREVLGVRGVPAIRTVAIVDRKDQEVTLEAGAVHGVTTGSVWSIRKIDGTDEIGRVEIASVRGATSQARIVAGSGAIVVGHRAVEVEHRYPQAPFSVEVRAGPELEAQATELRGLLDAFAPAGGSADARVYALAPRAAGGAEDPVPQLGPIEVPIWAVVGRDGRLLLRPLPIGEGSAAALCAKLAGLAVVRRVTGILDDSSELHDKIKLRLLRRLPNGEWVVAEPGASGIVELEEGEATAIEVQNGSDVDVFVGLFDLDPIGAVRPLTALVGGNQKWIPGAPIRLGVGADASSVSPPADYPLWPGVEDRREEALKLFATTVPTDFDLLAQGRSGPTGRRSIAGALFLHAMGGVRDGEVIRSDGSDEDWTTATARFVVRPKRSEVSHGQ